MIVKIVSIFLIFGFMYMWLGGVARKEFVDRGWHKEDASSLQEILMAPIFAILGVFFLLGMASLFTAILAPFFVICLLFIWLFLSPIGM